MAFPSNLPTQNNSDIAIITALEAIYNNLSGGFGTGLATEATLGQVRTEVENAVQELQDLNSKNVTENESTAQWLKRVNDNTRDVTNSNLTVAQILYSIFVQYKDYQTGQSGTAVSYSGSESSMALASAAIANIINVRKGNQSRVIVIDSGINHHVGASVYEWYCIIIG